MDDFDRAVQDKLDAITPWIALYIAVASAVCTLAMAADAFNGFRHKKLWFPCKYFSLNPVILTVLAVAMKLPIDTNTGTLYFADWLAKLCSIAFMSVAMANFSTSLGSMSNKEILANLAALGVLVITIVANMWIQSIQLRQFLSKIGVIAVSIPLISMLLLLFSLVSLAVTVPTIKRSLESKYKEMHKVALREEEAMNKTSGVLNRTDNNQKGQMMKYWVMAETSSPQFVIARSPVCTTSTLILLILPIALLISYAYWFWAILKFSVRASRPVYMVRQSESAYGSCIEWILLIQTIGVGIGTIATASRWFVAVGLKCSQNNRCTCFRKEIEIENYWIQTLLDWRDTLSSYLQIGEDKCGKCIHGVKWFALTFCIGVQILIVVMGKTLVFLSASLVSPTFSCFSHIKKFTLHHSSRVMASHNQHIGNDQDETELNNLNHYILLLEGETELPRRILKGICRRADKMIQRGRKKQPKNLRRLIQKSANFSGVGQFDTIKIPSLHPQEPLNCWTLPLMTLTTIAIAFPNTTNQKRIQLLSSVREGLSLVKIVEKTLNVNEQLVNTRKAADATWVGVVLYTKWLDMDLRKTSLRCRDSREALQELSKKAEKMVMEFKKEEKDPLMDTPLYWPPRVVAAFSMYRITETILLSFREENEQIDDEQQFERLSIMIADILGACLTNLPRVITTMCHHNAIEKREKNVHGAFLLLGQTEEILELLQKRKLPPSLDHDKAAYIDEWRTLFLQDAEHSEDSPSTSSNETVTTPVGSSEEHELAITVDS